MTFKAFQTIFLSKYPNGEAIPHGALAGTEGTLKTSIVFKPGGRCYSYKGAYEDVLCKLGINTISKERLHGMEKQLVRLIYENGKTEESCFDDDEPWVIDWSREIAELESRLADIKANYIIV